ncbi:2,3-butanediol dehydrogenase [Tessaracoccus sp. MC1756]|uniref:2,3-butanediol dehydrogenase n=1 Tax=Tessaracoccus sp. MC1756 TaxID=2760311 RepID=UPI001603EB48|nr:2,3-butanediol dehydrogenase [Tessaracoccus sp. MC1756]MBB1510938.1 2,3-butanediol dehydrogenase [Tessaracoccus sp. MC1756]
MRAAVFHGAKDVRVEDVKAPARIGEYDVRLRPLWCGICGTDLHEYAVGPIVIPSHSHPLTGAAAPQILGHEFSGEVLEVGSGVQGVSVGQRVSVMPLLFCGQCYQCRRGRGHLCSRMACIGLSFQWGGLAEECVVPATHVTVMPEWMSDIQGALVEPTAVAAYGVDRAGVGPGDSVLITGAGPIGVLASLYASALGANVYISEVNPKRLQLARSLDVGEVFNPQEADVEQELRDRTEGVGVDAVIECSGNERALQLALQTVRAAGHVSQTGLHTKPAAIDPMVLAERDITLGGTWCYPVTDWPRIIDLIARGRLDVEKAVSDQISIDDIVASGFEKLLDPTGDQVKVLVQATR